MKHVALNTRLWAAVLVPALLSAASLAADAQEVVKIGFSSPLSGPQASSGTDNRDGLLLAVKELNAKGVQVGGQKVSFDVVAEDDAGDPRQGVAVAQKLADAKVRYVVGPYNSGVAIPAGRIYNEAGMVMLTVGSNPKLTELGYPRLFRVGGNDVQVGTAMAVYAAKEMKVKNVAVVDDRTAYGQGLVAEFVAEAKRQGLNIVKQEFTTDKATDFTAILTAIRGAKPDAVVYGGYSAQSGPLLRQMVALGLQAKLLGGDAICDTETSRLSGGVADGRVICMRAGGLIEKSEAGRAFIAKYKAAYQRDPLTYAANFYDAAMLIADAMQKAGSTDPGKVADQIAKGSYKGVAAEYSFTAKHDLKSSPVSVYVFKGSQPTALSSF
ncbi:branched-chain amino acid ABC transporter substrate-binding protein [Azohydromonas australica]|uniref:branched-chain amino acid ABC transporter substrate-binding protein n=1 Tax=Azohydromonas australica TaxID=364039 RepID=UPI000687A744|nr:branched-chain amino acid ABC transporter substrate-binding protein [Azohydromonas australica]